VTDPQSINEAALGLVFLLGLRHGLDPDHIAVVDNLTFRAHEVRPGLAPWVGTWFALGHSISVAVVAVGVSMLSDLVAFPEWIGSAFDVLVILLLLLVGFLNLRALLRPEGYQPVGWRSGLVPRRLRGTVSAPAIVVIGMIFGLVFDTATQAVAWGTAASTGGGVAGALAIAAAFAAGMILTDTADSQIVARLLRSGGTRKGVQAYRCGVGWVIVALSLGMAAYAATTMAAPQLALPDTLFTLLGILAALLVVLLLLLAPRRRRSVA